MCSCAAILFTAIYTLEGVSCTLTITVRLNFTGVGVKKLCAGISYSLLLYYKTVLSIERCSINRVFICFASCRSCFRRNNSSCSYSILSTIAVLCCSTARAVFCPNIIDILVVMLVNNFYVVASVTHTRNIVMSYTCILTNIFGLLSKIGCISEGSSICNCTCFCTNTIRVTHANVVNSFGNLMICIVRASLGCSTGRNFVPNVLNLTVIVSIFINGNNNVINYSCSFFVCKILFTYRALIVCFCTCSRTGCVASFLICTELVSSKITIGLFANATNSRCGTSCCCALGVKAIIIGSCNCEFTCAESKGI